MLGEVLMQKDDSELKAEMLARRARSLASQPDAQHSAKLADGAEDIAGVGSQRPNTASADLVLSTGG